MLWILFVSAFFKPKANLLGSSCVKLMMIFLGAEVSSIIYTATIFIKVNFLAFWKPGLASDNLLRHSRVHGKTSSKNLLRKPFVHGWP